MSTGRRGSWVALGTLAVLAGASAVLSLSTAPTCPPASVDATGNRPTTATPAPAPPTATTVPPTPPATGSGTDPAPNGAHFTVSPVNVDIGQALHLAGTGCSPSFQAGVSIGPNFSPADFAFVTAAADGSWTVTMNVGDATPLGTVDVTADCVETGTHAAVFGYAPVPLQVTTFRSLTVLPGTTVDAGSTLHVSSVGPCPSGSPPYIAVVHLEKDPDRPTYALSANSGLLGPSGGEWSAVLLVPATTAPGSYVLLADCEIRRATVAFYRGVPITVRA